MRAKGLRRLTGVRRYHSGCEGSRDVTDLGARSLEGACLPGEAAETPGSSLGCGPACLEDPGEVAGAQGGGSQ